MGWVNKIKILVVHFPGKTVPSVGALLEIELRRFHGIRATSGLLIRKPSRDWSSESPSTHNRNQDDGRLRKLHQLFIMIMMIIINKDILKALEKHTIFKAMSKTT